MKAILKRTLFKVKTTLYLVLVTLFVATGCDKIEKPDELYTNPVTKIEAKVENATKYSNVVAVKLMVITKYTDGYIELARGDWKDGGFTIELPQTIDPSILCAETYTRGLLGPIADPSLKIAVSNRNAKAGTACFYGVDKDGNHVTDFYSLKIDENGNINEAFFSYVNTDVTIFGHDEREAIQDFQVGEVRYIANVKTSTTYSVDLKKGWNAWWFSNIRDEQKFTITNKWSTAASVGVKWYSFEDKWEFIN